MKPNVTNVVSLVKKCFRLVLLFLIYNLGVGALSAV